MSKLQPMIRAMHVAGIDPGPLQSLDTAHLVAHGHQIISTQTVRGLTLVAEARHDAIHVSLTVAEGALIEKPVHLCMGLFEPSGDQHVVMHVVLEAGAQATLLSHCLFSRPLAASHQMRSEIQLAAGARLNYLETHFHGHSGGMVVTPKAFIKLAEMAQLFSDFSLLSGRVGLLEMDYEVEVGDNAVAELTSRVHGRSIDQIFIRERVQLLGRNARGLIKSRIVAVDEAEAEVIGITEGHAAGARGHVDCLEIVRDRARVSANPLVRVTHPQAKVTHEAAIGSVDHQQLETLMARGMTPDIAVDLIVSGILKNA